MHANNLIAEFEASPLAINAGMHPEHYFHSETSPRPSLPSSPELDYRYPGQSYTIDELPTPVPEEDYLYRPQRTPSPIEEYHHKDRHVGHMLDQSPTSSASDGYEARHSIEGTLDPTYYLSDYITTDPELEYPADNPYDDNSTIRPDDPDDPSAENPNYSSLTDNIQADYADDKDDELWLPPATEPGGN
jgi:hypothetical protein